MVSRHCLNISKYPLLACRLSPDTVSYYIQFSVGHKK